MSHNHSKLFNIIAPLYAKFFDFQVKYYEETIVKAKEEWLEQGDYFNFIKMAEIEMKEHFKEVKVVDLHKRAAWYILEPYK